MELFSRITECCYNHDVPISAARCIVWTGDRRQFFYNPTQRTSVWEMPEDLVNRPDIDKLMQMPPETPGKS